MYYYCKNSNKKIIHLADCFHIHCVEPENIGSFKTLADAYEQGYRLCKHCNPLVKHYKREEDEIIDFCREKGLSVHLRNKCIFINSIRSRWKIALDKKNKIVLYHKNGFTTEKDHLSEIDGYHLQTDTQRNSIIAYLQYIIEHDYFRMLNPVYIPQKKKEVPPPRKGTKRYKSAQRRLEKYKRKKAIKNVLELIESLNIQSARIPSLSVC